jgi:hypothetical protein
MISAGRGREAVRLSRSVVLWDNPVCSPSPIVPEASTIMATATQPPLQPKVEFVTPLAMAERAEEAERLGDEQRRRAEEAEQRAARYAAKLRELGIEPD